MAISTDTIILDVRSKSRNQIDKLHWAVKRELKKKYQLLVRNKMRLGKISPARGNEEYELWINSHRMRKLDLDNLVGGLKQLIDPLVSEKFLFDDDTKYVPKMRMTQTKASKGHERIEITRIKH